MKIILITLATILSTTVSAQFKLNIGLGASTEKKALVELATQYDFNAAFVQVGYLVHLTRDVQPGAYINARIGKSLYFDNDFFAEPAIGYAYILRSSDRKELNSKGILYALTAGKNINNGSVYSSLIYCERVFVGIIGIRYNFN